MLSESNDGWQCELGRARRFHKVTAVTDRCELVATFHCRVAVLIYSFRGS